MQNNLIETLPDWFKQLPAGKEMIASQQRENADNRRAAIAELASADDAFVRQSLPPLMIQIEEAKKKVSAAQAAVAEADLQLQQTLHREMAVRVSHDTQQNRRRAFLSASAPSVIDDFASEMAREAETLRVLPPSKSESTDIVRAGRRLKRTFSDIESRSRRIEAAVRLLHTCDDLRLTCLDENDATQRIERLRKALPPLEVVEVKGVAQ